MSGKTDPFVRALVLILCACLALMAVIALGLLSSNDASAQVRIPGASLGYRLQVERASASYFGLHASPARLAAQLHQESGWRPGAASKYAVGLAQFTPATAKWLPEVCPELGGFDPWDAGQAIRAAACYDRYLYDRVTGASECDRWSFTLSAYNGGLGWVNRDRRLASASGADPARWTGHVELHSSRAKWAWEENRGYVRRILRLIEQAYVAAGWAGRSVCTA